MAKYFIKTRDGELGPFTSDSLPKHGLDRTTLTRKNDGAWLPLECHDELVPAVQAMVTRGAMHWGPFKRDHVTKPGHRQYSAILWDIPWGQSWEDCCHAMPATINGIYFRAPDRCVNTGSMWGEFDVPETPNALVFVNPSIPMNAGHIGWGFKAGEGRYTYGSKEISGAIAIPAGQPNGMFFKTANFEQMLQDMKMGGSQGPSRHPVFRYMLYKQVFVPNANPGAAQAAAEAASRDGYGLVGNNCMDNAYRVLTAYGLHDDVIPNPSFNPGQWIPNNWFNDIKAPAQAL